MFYQQDQNRFVEEYDQIPLTVLEHFDWPSLSQNNDIHELSNGNNINNFIDYEYLDENVPLYTNFARNFFSNTEKINVFFLQFLCVSS